MAKETPIPKAYIYSVEGVVDDEGNLRKFSIASLNRLLTCEFDLEGIAYSASLNFYLNNEEYQSLDKWPLTFKFYASKTEAPIELEMNLSYAPCFLSTQKSIVKHVVKEEKTTIVETEETVVKPKRKTIKKKEDEQNV